MSGKFPHGHPYKQIYPTKEEVIFKVWNIDKCIDKLNLQELKISSLNEYLNSQKVEKSIAVWKLK